MITDLSGNITGIADTEALCNNLKEYIATHANLKVCLRVDRREERERRKEGKRSIKKHSDMTNNSIDSSLLLLIAIITIWDIY